MQLKHNVIWIMLILLIVSIISAVDIDDIFQKGTEIDYKKPCFDEGVYCSGTTACNITILYPNNTAFINNQLMTNQYSFHNYTLPDTSVIGTYTSNIVCIDGGKNGTEMYYFRITDDGLDDTPIDNTTGIAVLVFMIFIIIGLFALGLKHKFSEEIITDLILKRGCITIGIFMLMFTSTIIATLVEAANVSLSDEMFMLMELFGWAGWCGMAWLVLKTLIDVLRIKKHIKRKKRTGDFEW